MSLKQTIYTSVRELAAKSSQEELSDMITEIRGGDYGELEGDLLDILETKWEGPSDMKPMDIQILDYRGRPYCTLGVLAKSTMKEVHSDTLNMLKSGLMGPAMTIDEKFVLMKGDQVAPDDVTAKDFLRRHKERRLTVMPTVGATWYLHDAKRSLPYFVCHGRPVTYVPELTTTVPQAREKLAIILKVSPDQLAILDQNMFPLPDTMSLWRHWVRLQPPQYTVTVKPTKLALPVE